MQTEVLQEFIVVAKHSSFRRAADELHISTPALSNHITALEKEVGATLFDRSGKTRLTSAGAHFYARAQQVLDLLDASIQETREVAKQAQPVRVQMFGLEDSALAKRLASIKTPFYSLPRDTKQDLEEPLKSGEADILVAPSIPTIFADDEDVKRLGIRWMPIGKAEFSYLVSSSNPLSKKDSLSLDDLRNSECLVTFGNMCDWFELVFPSVYGEDLDINLVQDPSMPVGSDFIPLCDLGQRIMPIYRGAAHHCCQYRSDLVAIDKLDGKPFDAMEYLAWSEKNPNPNVGTFVEEVHALVGDVKVDARTDANTQVDP